MKKIFRSRGMTAFLFLLAIVLLLTGTIGGTLAALKYQTKDYYMMSFDLDHIGVALYQNGKEIAHRTYSGKDNEAGKPFDLNPTNCLNGEFTIDLGADPEVKIGKQYPSVVQAQNTGTIDQYVRVVVRKYWVKDVSDPGGTGWFKFDDTANTKITDDVFKPEYIELSYNGSDYNTANWYKENSSKECDVYYYRGVLSPKQMSAPLFNNLAISNEITKYKLANVSTDGKTTIWTYAYNGYGFVVEVEVDAVQSHNARAAIQSAWGASTATMNQMGVPA